MKKVLFYCFIFFLAACDVTFENTPPEEPHPFPSEVDNIIRRDNMLCRSQCFSRCTNDKNPRLCRFQCSTACGTPTNKNWDFYKEFRIKGIGN